MRYSIYKDIFKRASLIAVEADTKTLKAFQNRAVVTRRALQLAHDQYDADVKQIRSTYRPEIAEERIKPLTEDYQALCELARKKCLDDLDEIIQAKRAAFSKANDAPSEEVMRLLQALNMRQSLSAAELAEVADKTAGNYHAVKILEEIAAKHDIPFPRVDAEAIDEDFSRAEDFCRRMINAVDTIDNKALSGREFAFYVHPEAETEADALFENLDGNILTAARAREKREVEQAAKSAPVPSDANAVRVFLQKGQSLATLSLQFGIDCAKIREANPGYDFSQPPSVGASVIVPSGRLRISSVPGAVIPEQCVPCHYDPPAPRPADGAVITLAEM